MVEHNFGKGSMCLSKSSSFYLEHAKQVESVAAAHDLAATPTGSPDDDDDNEEESGKQLKRKQSASSLFFKFQEHELHMQQQQEQQQQQQQTNPIFRIGAGNGEEEEEEGEDYRSDYNSRLSQGLRIGEGFLLDSRMLAHAAERSGSSSRLNGNGRENR